MEDVESGLTFDILKNRVIHKKVGPFQFGFRNAECGLWNLKHLKRRMFQDGACVPRPRSGPGPVGRVGGIYFIR